MSKIQYKCGCSYNSGDKEIRVDHLLEIDDFESVESVPVQYYTDEVTNPRNYVSPDQSLRRIDDLEIKCGVRTSPWELSDLALSRNILSPSRLSVESRAILVEGGEGEISIDCVTDGIEGTPSTTRGTSDFLEENGVICPVCRSPPDTVVGSSFYHEVSDDTVYKCYCGDIIIDVLKGEFGYGNNKKIGSGYRERITYYEDNNENGVLVPKRKPTGGEEMPEQHHRRLNSKISGLENELRGCELEVESLKQTIEGLHRELDDIQENQSYRKVMSDGGIESDNLSKEELIKKTKEMVGPDLGEAYVYCITESVEDEAYYYVGKTIDPVSRIKAHTGDKNVLDIIWLEPYGSEEMALEMEPKMAKDMILREETTNVLGGA